MIQPSRIYECLKYWVKNHPEYKGIKIEEEEEWRKKCPSFFDDTDTSEHPIFLFENHTIEEHIVKEKKYFDKCTHGRENIQ